MFNEKNVSFVNRQKLWNFYNTTLAKSVDVGYNPKTKFYDEDLAKSLKQNIAEFSAFKETSFKKEVESLLTTDGRLTPKSEWKKEALKVSDDYNYRWLETERHQTIANAHMAEKWKDFEQNVELYPNLQLVSVNDARVRPEHKVLDGIIRPFNDPFWKTHTPPLDWGCRCDIIQTDDEVTEVPGGFQTKIEFENNPGDSGKIFGGSAYEENLTKKEKNEALEMIEKPKEIIIPKGLEAVEKKFNYETPRELLAHLKDDNFVVQNSAKENTFYTHIGVKKINVNDFHLNGKRGEYAKNNVLVHELGHVIDYQKGLAERPEVKNLMDKYRAKYSANRNKLYRQLDSTTKATVKHSLKEKKIDWGEQAADYGDIMKAFNVKYGSGHTTFYYSGNLKPEREFLAHCFQVKYNGTGNKFIKRVDPELHDDMINLLDDLLK